MCNAGLDYLKIRASDYRMSSAARRSAALTTLISSLSRWCWLPAVAQVSGRKIALSACCGSILKRLFFDPCQRPSE